MFDSFAGNFIETSQGPNVKILRTGKDSRLFGITCFERLVRQIGPDWRDQSPTGEINASYLILRDDTVYDPTVINWLRDNPGRALAAGPARGAHIRADRVGAAEAWVMGKGPKPPELQAFSPKEIQPEQARTGMQTRTPFSFTPHGETELRGEQRLFEATCTGSADVVSGRLLRPLAFHLLRLVSRLRHPAIALTVLVGFCAGVAFWQFLQQQVLVGTLAAILAAFLSSLTGPLCKCVALNDSRTHRLGKLFGSLVPAVLFTGWYIGTGLQEPITLAGLLTGYAGLQSLSGIFRKRNGAPLALWRRGDYLISRLAPDTLPVLLLLLAGWALKEPGAALDIVAGWMLLAAAYVLLRLILVETGMRIRAT